MGGAKIMSGQLKSLIKALQFYTIFVSSLAFMLRYKKGWNACKAQRGYNCKY